MNQFVAIALGVAAMAWALAAWDILRKWVANHSAATLFRRQADYERLVSSRCEQFERAVQDQIAAQADRLEVNRRAIENLAKELDEETKALRAQQAGVLSGMQPRRRIP